MKLDRFEQIIVVSLNPAIDRVIEVPDFCVGRHQRGQRRARYPAGKGINVARAIAALGQMCTVTGFVGRPDAEMFQQFLRQQGIEDFQTVAVASGTRENITVVDPQQPGSDTHIVEQGFQVTAADITKLAKVLATVAAANRLVAFCGSLPPGLTVEHFVDLLKVCLANGAEAAVDSSGSALRAAAELPLWLVKPNRVELAELAGQPLPTAVLLQKAAAKLAGHIRWVLVSAGADGALLVDSRGSNQASAPMEPDRLVGTVGCGDVLFGGFLAGWQRDLSDQEDRHIVALRHGVAAATFAATQWTRAIDAQAVESLEREVNANRIV